MFEKSLTDLIRGIRANKNNQDKYIATSLDEIRNEVRKNDPDIKALAVQKLTYLHMQGYDMTWASFHVIEVMSSPNIKYKRLGYQAAATSFRQDTDVLMLCTNLIKKDLSSNNFMESALALHGLASIVTPDLGRDLCTDLIGMLNHSRPYIRKRVILVLFRVFLKYPDALRQAYPRLKEKLDDPDPSVVCAAVNVICELARRNPKSYLPLAPQLYALLTNSGNNWMLIKIIKLFAALAPLEPRLIKKLVPKISNLIETTSAMSLLYECIHTVITGEMIGVETEDGENEAQDSALARLCTAKLKIFIEDSDQNLKYLGLYALGKLLKVRPKAVLEHRETVLDCLDDADVSIRLRALDIVTGMVTPANLSKIVRRLMVQLLPPVVPASDAPSQKPKSVLEASDRTEIIKRIVSICSKDTYAHVTNFDWYVETLTELVKVNGVDVGELLSNQLIDVAVRVQEVRELTVERMQQLLKSDELLATASEPANNTGVLCAAAWITGEYCQFLSPPLDTVSRLLHPSIARLDPPTQAVCIHNAFKIYAHWATADPGSAPPDCAIHTEMVLKYLSPFRLSTDLEVQERACNVTELLQLVSSAAQTEHGIVPVLNSFKILFEEEINPLAPKAQRRVLVPEGLNLDKWIYEPEPEQDEVEEEEADERWTDDGPRTYGRENEASIDPVEMERRRQERADRLKNDPFYIPPKRSEGQIYNDIDVNEIPIVHLDLPGLNLDGAASGTNIRKKSKKEKAKNRAPSPPPPPAKSYNINRGGDMPATSASSHAGLSDDEDDAHAAHLDEATRALMTVDLTKEDDGDRSIRSNEAVRGVYHVAAPLPRSTPDPTPVLVEKKKKKKKAKDTDGQAGGEDATPTVEIKKKKKKAPKAVDTTDISSIQEGKSSTETIKDKSRKSKKPTPIADAPPRAGSPAANVDPGRKFLAARGLGADLPYERLPSPSPS